MSYWYLADDTVFWGKIDAPVTQNAVIFYTCICQSEASQNFTEEIIEQKLKF